MINNLLKRKCKGLTPRIVCEDGFTISIQASKNHYCRPRENDAEYTLVELGFPSEVPIPEILEYAEDADEPTGSVYGYVPVELVSKLLLAHGGFSHYAF